MIYFKKIRSVKLPAEVQGYIYFQCMNYKRLPKEMKSKIKKCCLLAGKEHHKALFEEMTSHTKSITEISMDHNICLRLAYTIRKKFYEEYAKYCFDFSTD